VHLALERLDFAGEFVVGLRARGVAQRLSKAPDGRRESFFLKAFREIEWAFGGRFRGLGYRR